MTRILLSLLAAVLAAGCASFAPIPDVAGVDAVLLGEQHDASAQPRLQERWVSTLASRRELAALVLEMADRGASTAGLPRDASAADVRAALHWDAEAWPWERYEPSIMAAVRAGVPVLGANLPGDALRTAMQDRSLDVLLPGPAMKAQQQAIRQGHCGLLPERQIQPMTRVQIARDRSMAQTIAARVVPGKTVVLISGAGHADPEVGVPRHLPSGVSAREVILPREETGKDYCAELRKQVKQE